MNWSDVQPEGWTVPPLGEVADVTMGQSPPGSSYNTEGIGLPFFQGKAEFGLDYPTPRKWCSAPSRVAEAGDILMSVRAPVGPTNVADRRCAIGRGLVAIRPRVGVPGTLIRHAIKLQESEIASWGTGTTFTAINKEHFKRIVVPLPPPDLRQGLAALLDESVKFRRSVIGHVTAARRLIARFRQAVLATAWSGRLTADWREANGDAVGPASDLIRILKSGAASRRVNLDAVRSRETEGIPESWQAAVGLEVFPFITSGSRGWAQYYSGDGPLFLRVGNLDRYRLDLDFDEVQHVDPPSNAETKRTRVLPGDLLISITAEIGMVGVAPPTLGEAYVNQHVAIARPHPAMNARFIAICVAAPNGGQKQLNVLQRGATKAGLGLDDIRSLVIPVPSAAEQAEMVERVDQLFALARGLEERIEQVELHIGRSSQAILAKAFRGELTNGLVSQNGQRNAS